MTIRNVILSASMLLVAAAAAFAADVTGKWTAQLDTPHGAISLTYEFKQDGAKLTGSVQGPMGDPIAIQDGKVDGDKVSFSITYSGPQGEIKITHEGAVKGDEITLKAVIPGMPDGPPPVTLKRAK